jgi:hypothetical protein
MKIKKLTSRPKQHLSLFGPDVVRLRPLSVLSGVVVGMGVAVVGDDGVVVVVGWCEAVPPRVVVVVSGCDDVAIRFVIHSHQLWYVG